MELNVEISHSEKKIREKIGKENWDNLLKQTHENGGNICAGCGYIAKEHQKLQIHTITKVINIDDLDSDSDVTGVLLCDACHYIKHFDVALNNSLLQLVNSSFTQKDLIDLCRKGNKYVNGYIIGGPNNDKLIFLLKTDPNEYLTKFLNPNPKFAPERKDIFKVIFTNKFDWSNCR